MLQQIFIFVTAFIGVGLVPEKKEIAPMHTLEVSISGIDSDKAKIFIALFSEAEGFPEDSRKAFRTAKTQALKGKTKVIFNDLPSGNYAIAVFHDENGDGKMNKNILGVPKEAYGFSNNVKNLLRAPYFKECAFAVPNAQKIEITIKHY